MRAHEHRTARLVPLELAEHLYCGDETIGIVAGARRHHDPHAVGFMLHRTVEGTQQETLGEKLHALPAEAAQRDLAHASHATARDLSIDHFLADRTDHVPPCAALDRLELMLLDDMRDLVPEHAGELGL